MGRRHGGWPEGVPGPKAAELSEDRALVRFVAFGSSGSFSRWRVSVARNERVCARRS